MLLPFFDLNLGSCSEEEMRASSQHHFLVRKSCWESSGGKQKILENLIEDVDMHVQATMKTFVEAHIYARLNLLQV